MSGRMSPLSRKIIESILNIYFSSTKPRGGGGRGGGGCPECTTGSTFPIQL